MIKLKKIASSTFSSIASRNSVLFRLTTISYRILHTFAVSCNAPFSETEKMVIRNYLDEQSAKVGGDKALAQSWDLEIDELEALKARVVMPAAQFNKS